jgi:hypothetical protein
MNLPMSESQNSRSDRIGKTQSFWVRHETLAKLARMARGRGVTRNAMLSILVEEASED